MQLIELSFGVKSRAQFEEFLADTVSASFESFSFQYATGYWRGAKEDCAILQIVCHSPERSADAYDIARWYCELSGETCVLVTVYPVTSAELVYADGKRETL
jgi:hypothetical protein